MNIERIGLFFNPLNHTKINGCYKVVVNLMKGLNQLGISISENKIEKYNGCLQGIPNINNLLVNTLIGPEIVVTPAESIQLFNKYKYWVQPSQWVIDYMKSDKFIDITLKNDMSVWSVGIDTEMFNQRTNTIFEYDCFIYYKNVTKQTPISKLQNIENELKKRNLKYKVLSYGSYTEKELQFLIHNSKFAISLVGTESQGIGYMEMLSSGIPLYVIDEKTFLYKGFTFTNDNVSSCPYFDERCGIKTDNLNRLDEFIMNIDKYKPRDYILENHTLKLGADKYIKILDKINV